MKDYCHCVLLNEIMFQYGTKFVIDEALIKEVGSLEYFWLWVANEPECKGLLEFSISRGKHAHNYRNCFHISEYL